jgi:Fur family ferric uptake transcriptional regulator
MRSNCKDASDMNHRPVTAQRRLLLDILRDADGHLDAKELYRQASAKNPHISLATVYRTLRLFKELGLVDERHLDKVHCYYEIKRSSEHYHVTCVACGRVIDFKSALVEKLVKEVQHNSRFDIVRAVLYLEGYCPECKLEDKAS